MLNEKVVRDLQITRGWTREFIDALVPYYVATLAHLSKGHAGPVYEIVDKMWHTHILRTRDYADFCAANFGRFIHHETLHEPSSVDAPQSNADFFRDYGLSVQGLAETFERKPDLAKCEVPDDTPPRAELRGAFALEVAKCEPPAPPSVALGLAACKPSGRPRQVVQAPTLAKCEHPDGPPTWAGGRT